jgi:hypothetical protein
VVFSRASMTLSPVSRLQPLATPPRRSPRRRTLRTYHPKLIERTQPAPPGRVPPPPAVGGGARGWGPAAECTFRRNGHPASSQIPLPPHHSL